MTESSTSAHYSGYGFSQIMELNLCRFKEKENIQRDLETTVLKIGGTMRVATGIMMAIGYCFLPSKWKDNTAPGYSKDFRARHSLPIQMKRLELIHTNFGPFDRPS